jgi:hypothetical protein
MKYCDKYTYKLSYIAINVVYIIIGFFGLLVGICFAFLK